MSAYIHIYYLHIQGTHLPVVNMYHETVIERHLVDISIVYVDNMSNSTVFVLIYAMGVFNSLPIFKVCIDKYSNPQGGILMYVYVCHNSQPFQMQLFHIRLKILLYWCEILTTMVLISRLQLGISARGIIVLCLLH